MINDIYIDQIKTLHIISECTFLAQFNSIFTHIQRADPKSTQRSIQTYLVEINLNLKILYLQTRFNL